MRKFKVLFMGALTSAALAGALTACGPTKTLKATEANSRGAEPPVPQPNYRMAECNRIELNAPYLRGQLSTYYSAGKFVNTYLNMNLTNLPPEIPSSGTHYIQLFRWRRDPNSGAQINSIPVTMYFVMKTSGAVSNPMGSQKISRAVLENIISSQRLGNYGVTLSNFFERHFVVLVGMDLQYDAVKFAYYNSAAGSEPVSTGDVLLPAFYANPNVYMAANPYSDLYTLHPNYAYRSANATEDEYYAMTEQICAGFFSRIPASIDIPPDNFWGGIQRWFQRIRAQFREALAALKLGKR